MADRRRGRRPRQRAAGTKLLTAAALTAGDLTLTPLTTQVARQLVDGEPLELDRASGWPHEDTVPSIRLALEAGCDPGWLILRDGVVIGECAVKGGRPYGRFVEISYGLAGPQRGRGFGTSIVNALSTWLLRQPGVEAVTAEVRRDNAASIRVLEKAGFRQAEETPTYLRFSRTRSRTR